MSWMPLQWPKLNSIKFVWRWQKMPRITKRTWWPKNIIQLHTMTQICSNSLRMVQVGPKIPQNRKKTICKISFPVHFVHFGHTFFRFVSAFCLCVTLWHESLCRSGMSRYVLKAGGSFPMGCFKWREGCLNEVDFVIHVILGYPSSHQWGLNHLCFMEYFSCFPCCDSITNPPTPENCPPQT